MSSNSFYVRCLNTAKAQKKQYFVIETVRASMISVFEMVFSGEPFREESELSLYNNPGRNTSISCG
jgi:hypothetical protein